jgi:putative ABC transport system substrate-binding protein
MQPFMEAFPEALRALGRVDGQTITLDWRFASPDPGQLVRQVDDLVARAVDVLVAGGTLAAVPAMRATTAIPIVFVGVSDPVRSGLVVSLAHPASNLTGISLLAPQISAKCLELLSGVAPGLRRCVVLADPANPSIPLTFEATRQAADALGVSVHRIDVRSADDLPTAFELGANWGAQGIVVLPANLLQQLASPIAAMAMQAHLPTAFPAREDVEAGGLLGYGPSLTDQWRRAAAYVDKILRGVKPSDLPIEQPSAFDLVVNRTAAETLGIAIPPDIAALVTEWVQ